MPCCAVMLMAVKCVPLNLGRPQAKAPGCVDETLLGNCEHGHHKDMSAAVMITTGTLMVF